MTALLLFHVTAGSLALVGGATALIARKGGAVHRRSGLVFVATMLAMSASGALLAALHPPNRISVIAGLFTFYLVATAWQTVQPRLAHSGAITLTLLLVAAAVGTWGLSIAAQQTTVAARLVFGAFSALALLGASLDVRVLRRGAPIGKHRLARHLWRMTLALWIATASLFLGQADELPDAWRIWWLLALPPLAVLFALCWWLAHTLRGPRRRASPARVAGGRPQPSLPLP